MQIEQLQGLTIVKVLESYSDCWVLEMSDGKKYTVESKQGGGLSWYGETEHILDLKEEE